MKGNYEGSYQHLSKRIPEERRKQITRFNLEITEFDGLNFIGFVEDDLESGGMLGRGSIQGKINKNKINFVKCMPVRTSIGTDGRQEDVNQAHPRIYYTGILENEVIRGAWKIKFGISKMKDRIGLTIPIRGIWEMKRIDSD